MDYGNEAFVHLQRLILDIMGLNVKIKNRRGTLNDQKNLMGTIDDGVSSIYYYFTNQSIG